MTRMFAIDLGNGAQLRPLEPWQAEEFAEHIDEVREHIKPWVPMGSRIVDAETARATLQRFADLQAADSGRLYGLWIDGKLSGGTLFKGFDAEQGVCEIGVWLSPAAEGRGLIKQAVSLMIEWAAKTRGIKRFEWRTSPHNVRSRAAARRLGFTPEGVLRSSIVFNGERHDTEVWSLLA